MQSPGDRATFVAAWRDRQCTGKRPFNRRRDAKKHAKQIGQTVEAYWCHWCQAFHVGHAPRRRQ